MFVVMNGFGSNSGRGCGYSAGRGKNRKNRNIGFDHQFRYFKPSGVPMSNLEEIVLQEDEIETLRLKNIEGLDIIAGAERMAISKSTFARIYNNAVSKMSDALINGKAIKIDK